MIAMRLESMRGCAASDCSCTDVGQYWSATSVAEVLPLRSVWSVLFFRGTIGGADKTSGFFARAVRSLPCGTFLAKFDHLAELTGKAADNVLASRGAKAA